MAYKIDLAERLASIVKTQEEIASIGPDRDAVMRIVTDRLRELTGAEGAVIEIVRGDELHYHTTSGCLTPHRGTLFDVEGSLSGLCIQTREALRSDDTLEDPRVNREIAEATGSRSVIVVPLIYEDQAIGVLKVASKQPRMFQDIDTWSLQMMAGLIASSMQHAADYEAKVASEARFRLLFDRNLGGAFRTTTDGRILDVNSAMAEILGYDSDEDLRKERTWNLYPQRSDREQLLQTLREKGSITRHPLRLRKKDGSEVEVITNMDLVPGVGETYLLGTILEVS